MQSILISRNEMDKISSDIRIKPALKARIPPATKLDFQRSQDISV